jgi:hypothetical protein
MAPVDVFIIRCGCGPAGIVAARCVQDNSVLATSPSIERASEEP